MLIECSECPRRMRVGQRWDRKATLFYHYVRLHAHIADADRLLCDDCDHATLTAPELWRHHLRSHLSAVDFDLHTCDLCRQQLTSKAHLLRHLDSLHNNVNSESTMFGCDDCAWWTRRKIVLMRHNAAKHRRNNAPWQCDECRLQFNSDRGLKQHRLVKHAGAVYVCEQCDVECGQKGSMMLHLRRVHSGYLRIL